MSAKDLPPPEANVPLPLPILRRHATALVALLACAAILLMPALTRAQESSRSAASIQISFLPPPLEHATYSLGIYDAKNGALVRHLQEFAPEGAFTVGLNGLITNWDGKDGHDKLLPPGKYVARGYAVGPMKVEGEAILGNDWAATDKSFRPIFIDAIGCAPEDDDLIVSAQVPHYTDVVRFSGKDGRLLWRHMLPTGDDVNHPGPPVPSTQSTLVLFGGDVLIGVGGRPSFAINAADGKGSLRRAPETGMSSEQMRGVSVPGKDGTTWKVEGGELHQLSASGEVLRSLVPAEGEPRCVKVAASTANDKLYLLERLPSANWERVRGLSWVESKEENGKKISTWQTFFERNIGPPSAALGLGNPLPVLGDWRSAEIEVTLVANPLSPPDEHTQAKLVALCDGAGTYLATSDGLRLRQISQKYNLRTIKLTKGEAADSLRFFQSDGAAWDEFSIKGVKEMMAFDAGEFELTATGEKPAEKAAEPLDP